MSRIAVKYVGKPLEVVDVASEQYRSELCEKYIGKGNYLEFVRISSDIYMAVDEEGLCKNLEHNFYLNVVNSPFSIQKIVGTAVFVRTKPINGADELWDYEADSLTDDDIIVIKEMLKKEYQEDLDKDFGCVFNRNPFISDSF